MPRFKVTLQVSETQQWEKTVEVEAESREAAKAAGFQLLRASQGLTHTPVPGAEVPQFDMGEDPDRTTYDDDVTAVEVVPDA